MEKNYASYRFGVNATPCDSYKMGDKIIFIKDEMSHTFFAEDKDNTYIVNDEYGCLYNVEAMNEEIFKNLPEAIEVIVMEIHGDFLVVNICKCITESSAETNMVLPKDSGSTREFETGAHRDNAANKGRCDLLPHEEVAMVLRRAVTQPPIQPNMAAVVFVEQIGAFMKDRNVEHLADAIRACHVGLDEYKDMPIEYMFLDVSHLYEAGAIKYKENNWKNGMPVKVYIDSGCRHFFKARCHITDEPHYRGPVWNLLCAMWTATNKPELLENLVVIEKA